MVSPRQRIWSRKNNKQRYINTFSRTCSDQFSSFCSLKLSPEVGRRWLGADLLYRYSQNLGLFNNHQEVTRNVRQEVHEQILLITFNIYNWFTYILISRNIICNLELLYRKHYITNCCILHFFYWYFVKKMHTFQKQTVERNHVRKCCAFWKSDTKLWKRDKTV